MKWSRGKIILWDVYPGLRLLRSLTPGYYLSPRWGFGLRLRIAAAGRVEFVLIREIRVVLLNARAVC